MNKHSKFTLVVAITTLLYALPLIANAHYIWIERGAKTARVYYGEVAEVREQSPGRMDVIQGLKAASAGAVLGVKRTQRYFELNGVLASQIVAIEPSIEVKDWSSSGIGIVKPMYYARHSEWPLKAAITGSKEQKLDIQPVAGSKDTFLVLFDGKPLPKNKLVIVAPNDWEQEHKTDDAGKVKVMLPWQGQYVLEVIYKETLGGEFEGKKFDAVRHRSILTVVQPKGISPKGTGGGASSPGGMAQPMAMMN
jgi:hypothetical protein